MECIQLLGQEPVEDNTLAEIIDEDGVVKVKALSTGTLKIVVKVTLDGVTLTGKDIIITIRD